MEQQAPRLSEARMSIIYGLGASVIMASSLGNKLAASRYHTDYSVRHIELKNPNALDRVDRFYEGLQI